MTLTRFKLKEIYDSLSNSEKTKWAQNANYSNYQGLYKYLSRKSDEVAYNRIVDALFKTVGGDRFKILTEGEKNYMKNQLEKLLDRIYEKDDTDFYIYDIFIKIAERKDFDTNVFFNLETQMTDMLQVFPNSKELIEKIRVTIKDIINAIIVQNFTIPIVQKKLDD